MDFDDTEAEPKEMALPSLELNLPIETEMSKTRRWNWLITMLMLEVSFVASLWFGFLVDSRGLTMAILFGILGTLVSRTSPAQ